MKQSRKEYGCIIFIKWKKNSRQNHLFVKIAFLSIYDNSQENVRRGALLH